MFRYAQDDKYADRAAKYSPSYAKREYGEAGREIEHTQAISSTASGPPPLDKEEE